MQLILYDGHVSFFRMNSHDIAQESNDDVIDGYVQQFQECARHKKKM